MIAIIDYGMGNLRSVQKAFEFLSFAAKIVERPEQLSDATHLVLPGDAAFGDAMRNLRSLGWDVAIAEEIAAEKPFLGICVGLQLMFSESEEMGKHSGLGILPGKCLRFPVAERVPQIGWNRISIKREVPILAGVPEGTFFYFVHSFYVQVNSEENSILKTMYGLKFDSAIQHKNIYGAQFHPEKSHKFGMKLLKNFSKI